MEPQKNKNTLTKSTCTTCASPVFVSTSDEGTSCYLPVFKEEDKEELIYLVRKFADILYRFENLTDLRNSIQNCLSESNAESALSKFPQEGG